MPIKKSPRKSRPGIAPLACLGFALLFAVTDAAHAFSDADRDGIALLILGPKENPVKSCAVSAIRINLGLSLQKVGKASDEQIKATLVDTVSEPKARVLAESEYALWQQGHRPDQVAEMEFHGCLDRHDLHLRENMGALGTTCFNFLTIPATVEVLKISKKSQDEAAQTMRKVFAGKVTPEALDQIVGQVYASSGEADQYLGHRQAFVMCMRTAK